MTAPVPARLRAHEAAAVREVSSPTPATIVICDGGVLCEGCLMPRGNPTFHAVSNFL